MQIPQLTVLRIDFTKIATDDPRYRYSAECAEIGVRCFDRCERSATVSMVSVVNRWLNSNPIGHKMFAYSGEPGSISIGSMYDCAIQ